MKHYIFEATGYDIPRRGKRRTEYRHEALRNRDEAIFAAKCLLRALRAAGWAAIRVEVKEVTETMFITALKEEQHDT